MGPLGALRDPVGRGGTGWDAHVLAEEPHAQVCCQADAPHVDPPEGIVHGAAVPEAGAAEHRAARLPSRGPPHTFNLSSHQATTSKHLFLDSQQQRERAALWDGRFIHSLI